MKGECTKGKDCQYWHPPPCRYHKAGYCSQGSKCIFMHPHVATPGEICTDARDTSPKPKQQPKTKPKAKVQAVAIIKPLLAMVASIPTVETSLIPRNEVRINDLTYGHTIGDACGDAYYDYFLSSDSTWDYSFPRPTRVGLVEENKSKENFGCVTLG